MDILLDMHTVLWFFDDGEKVTIFNTKTPSL